MQNEIQHLFLLAVLRDSAISACFTKLQMPVETRHPRESLFSYVYILPERV
jgi:hypothetical protein